MTIRLTLFISLFLMLKLVCATKIDSSSYESFEIIIEQVDSTELNSLTNTVVEVKFKRGKAILFTVLTGLFGGHRIYFGTKPRTPIIYSVTLGGLGILPLIDLVHIIFTKDLSKYEYKSEVIMWGN